jgi:5-methylcytosine-specific restriction protein A
MPTAALRPCSVCYTLGCTVHERPAWGHARPVKRIGGHKLQRLRAQLFRQHPLCVLCLATGRTALATIRDHIIPLIEGGTETDDNIQALCQSCSDAKTQREAERGKWRAL